MISILNEKKFHKIAADMKPELGEHYLKWIPFCQESLAIVYQDIFELPFVQQHFCKQVFPKTDGRKVWFDQFDSYIKRSGKLIRPYLVCLCLEALGHDPKHHGFGVSISELIQTASLIFDDIADDSLIRRGGKTVHKETGLRVATEIASSWLNIPFELINEHKERLSEPTAYKLRNAIAWEHWVTGLGVTIDVTWPWVKQYDYNPEQYLQSLVHRTGSYSYRLPIKIAGILSNLDTQRAKVLENIGESIGISFQLIDDILNIKPFEEQWGKIVAEDIIEGKITAQVLFALKYGSPSQGQRLIEILNSNTSNPELLTDAVNIIVNAGGIKKAMILVEKLLQDVNELIDSLDFIDPHYKRIFHELVHYIITRKS